MSWNEARIAPVYTEGNRDCLSNYTGISLLSVVGKMLLTNIKYKIISLA